MPNMVLVEKKNNVGEKVTMRWREREKKTTKTETNIKRDKRQG